MAKVERTLLTPTSPRRRRSGGLTLSSYRGLLIVRSRPKTPKAPPSELQRAWINRFKCYAYWSKFADPDARRIAEELVPNTGWYWRDVIERAMSGKLLLNREELPITTPTANIYATSPQAISSGVEAALTAAALNWDNNYFWNPSANQSRLTCRTAGLYAFGCVVNSPTNTTARRKVSIIVNGTTRIAQQSAGAGTSTSQQLTLTGIWYMHANDYAQVFAQPSSSGQTFTMEHFWVVALTPEPLM